MSGLTPVRVYGLEVKPGDILTSANLLGLPASIHISMAAIDPNATPVSFEPADEANGTSGPRATLKIIRMKHNDEDEDDEDDEDYDEDDEDDEDDDDIDAIERRLQGAISDDDEDDESSEEEEAGPSDPAKSKKARKQAAVKQLLEALASGAGDEDMDVDIPNGINGAKKGKGKANEDDDDDESIESDEEGDIEQFVVCTLDPARNYQQTLDITIGENEDVMFQVIGTHTVYLTGNFVVDMADDGSGDYDEDDEDDLDYSLGEDDYDLEDEDEESDDLDDLEDPRVTEIESEDEAPKLVQVEKKGKNKRAADDSDVGLDDLIKNAAKSADANGESKRQAKKLKNNAGQPTASTDVSSSAEKKSVKFAKNLEQGPTGSPLANKKEAKKDEKKDEKPKATTGRKVLAGGVTVDDKKIGTGPAAKNGNRIGMRYIGKLEKDGKVFDSNKKGAPFTFKLGKGEVIKGWDIGIAGMQVGGERRITIPASMGYGSKGMPGIPANSTLVFDVKMLSCN